MRVRSLSAGFGYVRSGLAHRTGPAPEPRLERLSYESYWADRTLPEPAPPPADDPWDFPRYQAMLQLLDRSERIVDLGCGNGAFLALLRKEGFEEISGVDVSPSVVEHLVRHGYDARVLDLGKADLTSIATPRPDVIVLSEVLEHVVELEALLDEALRVAGRVIVSHPNIGYWPHRLRYLFGRFPVQWAWHPGEHARFLTLTDLLEHAARRDYAVGAVLAPVGSPWPALRERFPNLLGEHVIVELKRRP